MKNKIKYWHIHNYACELYCCEANNNQARRSDSCVSSENIKMSIYLIDNKYLFDIISNMNGKRASHDIFIQFSLY